VLTIETTSDMVHRDLLLRKLEDAVNQECQLLKLIHEQLVELNCRKVKWPNRI
jgi:hypothetical protein